MMMMRHGDVLLKRIEQLPDQLKEKETNIIVEGEATGHSHRLESGDATILIDNNNNQFIEARTIVELVHEEHRTIQVPPGQYQVIRQQEYNPYIQAMRDVSD